jgi:carbon monoxide dehydrogenase subunit G
MDFKGKYVLPAPPGVVWAALREPEMLAAALPGCEAVEKLSDTEFRGHATVKVGPVEAHFDGRMQLEELPASTGIAHATTLTTNAEAGAAGFARGISQIRLVADGTGTLVEYETTATVGGRLAQAGQKSLDAAAKTLADEFFAKFAILMQAQMAASSSPKPSAPIEHARRTPSDEGLGPQVWVVGLIGIVIILLIVFSIVL